MERERPPASALIFDWNTAGNGYPHRDRPVEFDDETLRDGLQSPSVRDPDIETKIRHEHGIEPTDHLVEEIFRAAKERNRVLAADEILEICKFEALEKERPLPLDTLHAWKTQVGDRPPTS